MTTEIVTLNCPKCGSPDQVVDHELHYGIEFRCKNCGTISVLIMNQKLYMPLPGERICIKCGRVAQREARFCQCGESLIKKCVNQSCLREIPVDHEICDFCGWRQNAIPFTAEGDKVSFTLAIKHYLDPENSVSVKGREFIEGLILKSRDAYYIGTLLKELAANGIDMTPHVVQIVNLINDPEIKASVLDTFENCTQKSRSIIPEFPDSQKYVNEGLVSVVKYMLQNHNADGRMDQTRLMEEFLSKPINQSIIKKISQLGVESIPDLVRLMDYTKNYLVKDQCKKILVSNGSSSVPLLVKSKSNQALSKATIEWIDHAIQEINGQLYS